MIALDSPLRHLHPQFAARQILILDGIRHAAEIADLAYQRLRSNLTTIALHEPEPGTQQAAILQTAAYLDAWTVVDALDRLRTLTKLIETTDAARNDYDRMLAGLEMVRPLRNVADHLAQRIDQVLSSETPALGALTWFTFTGDQEGLSCLLLPGSIAKRVSAPAINPAGKPVQLPTDFITLRAGPHNASLSTAISLAAKLISRLERSVTRVCKEHGLEAQNVPSDLTVKLRLQFFDPDVNPSGT